MKKANSNSNDHEVWCTDGFNKIYMVRKSMHGPSSPIHVQVKIHLGTNASIIQCTDPSYSYISRLSTSNVCYQCQHVLSVTANVPHGHEVTFQPDTLQVLQDNKLFIRKTLTDILCMQEMADAESVPPITYAIFLDTCIHCNILAPIPDKHKTYSQLDRIIASYNPSNQTWSCGCHVSKQKCIHVKMAMSGLHIAGLCPLNKTKEHGNQDQEQPTPMMSSLKGFSSDCKQAEHDKIYEYQKQRMIPANIDSAIVNKIDTVLAPDHFIPSEMECDYCHITLLKEHHVMGAAKLITLTHVKNNIYTFHKRCPTCNVTYMYTDYKQ